jgi:uncharacterized membrane protein YcjF (UPF0283 family)
MNDLMSFIIALPFFLLTQGLVYLIYKKTHQFAIALTPNLGLFGLGLIVSLIFFVIGSTQAGSWADLGFIILMMLTIFATLASTLTSVLFLYLLAKNQKKPVSK